MDRKSIPEEEMLEELLRSSSESEESNLFGDDTDDDPNFIIDDIFDDSDSSEDELQNRPMFGHCEQVTLTQNLDVPGTSCRLSQNSPLIQQPSSDVEDEPMEVEERNLHVPITPRPQNAAAARTVQRTRLSITLPPPNMVQNLLGGLANEGPKKKPFPCYGL